MATENRQIAELATRAPAIYDAKLRHKLEPHEQGRYLALEVETGDYAIGDRFRDANGKLRERHPLPTLFFVFRIGYPAAVKMGGHYGVECDCRVRQSRLGTHRACRNFGHQRLSVAPGSNYRYRIRQ